MAAATNERRALARGLASVLLWSTVATAFKLTLNHLRPAQLLVLASATSLLIFLVALALRGQLKLLVSYRPRDYLRSAFLGFLNPALYYLVLFEAYDRLPAQEAQALNYTWALALALLSVPLLRQRLSLRDGVAGIVCYGGALVVATRGRVTSLELSDALGVALALGSAFVWALYWIYNARDERDPVASQALGFAFGLPWVVGYCAFTVGLEVPPLEGFLGAVYIGGFEMGVTFLLWLGALRSSKKAARIGNLIFLSPCVSLILIRVFLREPIYDSTLVGLALILAGLALQQLQRPPDVRRNDSAETTGR